MKTKTILKLNLRKLLIEAKQKNWKKTKDEGKIWGLGLLCRRGESESQREESEGINQSESEGGV